jgi:hypothetical protein
MLATNTHFIFGTRNAWVGDLICLCVMEDRKCAVKWMAEGATALKRFAEWTIGSKNKKQCEEEQMHVLFSMYFFCFEFSDY